MVRLNILGRCELSKHFRGVGMIVLYEFVWGVRTWVHPTWVPFLQMPPMDGPVMDTAEQVYISSLALLKVLVGMGHHIHQYTGL